VDSVTAQRVGQTIEAMLLAPILRPIVAGTNVVGDYELDLLAGEIARHDGMGFAQLIARRLQHAS